MGSLSIGTSGQTIKFLGLISKKYLNINETLPITSNFNWSQLLVWSFKIMHRHTLKRIRVLVLYIHCRVF